MALELTKFDAADYIHTDEDRAVFLNAALEEYDPKSFARSLSSAAKSKGIEMQINKDMRLSTLMDTLAAMGLSLSVSRTKGA